MTPTKASIASPIVSLPPSAGNAGNPLGTNLDAALAHVKPQAKRLLPRLPKKNALKKTK